MLLLPRLRLALARRPYLYWLFVAGCAAIVWAQLANSAAELDDQRQQWGETRRVWVAATDIAQGDPVHVIARDYPIAMVTTRAIVDEPVGAIAVAPIAAGEVLVTADVGSVTDLTVPTGWVVFAFASDDSPATQPGTAVAIFGSGQRWCDGVVLAVADQLEISVPPTCAEAVSIQVAAGAVVLGTVTK